MSPILPTSMPFPRTKPAWHVAAGLGLTIPALVLLAISYVEPAAWAIRTSLGSLDVRTSTPITGSGADNYRTALDGGLGRSIGFTLSLLLIPLIVVAVIAPALAWYAHRGGTVSRWATRALLAVPLVCYAPAAVAVGWRIERAGGSPASVGLMREASWLTAVGITSALAVTMYLAALRRIDPQRRPGPALWVAGVIGCLVTAALAIQTFTLPYVLAGADTSTASPMIGVSSVGFGRGPFGPAAAIATVLLAILAVLGLAVTATILASGARLEVDEVAARAPVRRRPALVASALLILILGVSLYALLPWLRHAASSGVLPAELTASAVLTNTWAPPLVSTFVGVAVAALAGFGIGALRPFGRHSELLLLPFAPFLLVGPGPLALRAYAAGATADRWDSVLGLIPPTRLAIPALFVFTLLFRGQWFRAERERQLGAGAAGWWRGYLAPALPMLLIATLSIWVIQAQDLIWPALSGAGRFSTGPVVLVTQLRDGASPSYALAMPPLLLALLLVVAVAVQLIYLDRVALRVGRPEYEGGPRT